MGIFFMWAKRILKTLFWLAIMAAIVVFIIMPFFKDRQAAVANLPSLGPDGGTLTPAKNASFTIRPGVLTENVKFKILIPTAKEMVGLPYNFTIYGGIDIEPQTKLAGSEKTNYISTVTVPLNRQAPAGSQLMVVKKDTLQGVVTNTNIMARVNDDNSTATFTTRDTGLLILVTEDAPSS